jgi:hypothetical protein
LIDGLKLEDAVEWKLIYKTQGNANLKAVWNMINEKELDVVEHLDCVYSMMTRDKNVYSMMTRDENVHFKSSR